ncbi:fructose-bisphosphate aldolase [Jimgerdemannia flammicorona]|uniref:Fructose-bisphosphate aldolase n=1 Tax=Jimgerdemannia flammicorona TaxID=994334 RepID=A0A433Q3S1_9FUNG|nr:fructose-bisphosphate aldolase [Jimgerdemannia flammicorona]
MGILDLVPAGVITGHNLRKVLNYAKEHKFAIPAVNCTSTSTINAVLEAARDIKSPIIIQFSNGGSAYFAGKGLSNAGEKASILGAIAGAYYIRRVAPAYGIPVIVHSDHCAKKLLPWFDGMLAEDEAYFTQHGEPLFSSHMLDLSEEPKEENIAICLKYLNRMAKIDCLLEMEIGITGGEEDGVNNESVDNASLYTQPEDILDIYRAFSGVTDLFTIAAAFGNVHGVYKVGNVQLHPELLGKHQAHVQKHLGLKDDKPVYFVFHGGSGSSPGEIATAVSHGVIKMNVDTGWFHDLICDFGGHFALILIFRHFLDIKDTQWAYWLGIKEYYEKKKGYLQAQVGNPDGDDKPNKKHYDPRVFIREGEKTMIKRVQEACKDLGNVGTL